VSNCTYRGHYTCYLVGTEIPYFEGTADLKNGSRFCRRLLRPNWLTTYQGAFLLTDPLPALRLPDRRAPASSIPRPSRGRRSLQQRGARPRWYSAISRKAPLVARDALRDQIINPATSPLALAVDNPVQGGDAMLGCRGRRR